MHENAVRTHLALAIARAPADRVREPQDGGKRGRDLPAGIELILQRKHGRRGRRDLFVHRKQVP